MSKLAIIESVLHNKYKDLSKSFSETDKDKNGVEFTMTRNIVNSPDTQYLLYRFDISEDSLFPFFKNTGVSNLKKMCDYIMFIEEKSHLHIFLVELKKGTDPAKKQLDAAECFSDFIIKTISRLGLEFSVSDETLHYKKIRISESKSKKRTLSKGITERENGVIEHEHPKSFYVKHYLTY
ncbi:hypothetical protein [Tenacibaculum finnmarkense]|uniref:hypothetical protein n=1 Tax=Tenacibaculum finnmarkense TaxID=2781243 RepID=UPI00187B1307|nr:hypothetical protein [Tenacibaculum finnmarkense]MBE7660183.1 hypothetical protein [Tenacibaculum finnmarkense genomovar finnmarkense]MCG8232963.1 hypothetical protein [Tenacibaculum finnmarkense genomovar finnmarkense]MCG8251908.1 hypothetical protein [Tenacibaculum finnmarkense genomovar finnmarkense]MCG8815437.1 hypothetical protein [Tenacibaculum finnmarkense]MCG8820461.1 hypothetical protein [Tenacibaculum finnmarkense]